MPFSRGGESLARIGTGLLGLIPGNTGRRVGSFNTERKNRIRFTRTTASAAARAMSRSARLTGHSRLR